MATITFRGVDTYIGKLALLRDHSDVAIRNAVYAGASIVADEIRYEINQIPIVRNQKATPDNQIDGVTRAQKNGLQDGFGISKFGNDRGFINVKLGFDGYNKTRTKKYPMGQPNALIARSVNSGTSFRKKRRFVDKAVNSSRKNALNKMSSVLDDEIKKIMK